MNASAIVKSLIETGDDPRDFLDRNNDLYAAAGEGPSHEYHFNIGEGSFRCGMSFDITAESRHEAVVLANRFLRNYFRLGSVDLPTPESLGNVREFNVYIDDDFEVTEQDIVTENGNVLGDEQTGEQR